MGWFTVKYTIDVSQLSGEEVTNRLHWCRETLGVNELRRWNFNDYYFVFEDEQDYMWFKLRWM
jgi:hypothetical protein